jgi:hypothetical protein
MKKYSVEEDVILIRDVLTGVLNILKHNARFKDYAENCLTKLSDVGMLIHDKKDKVYGKYFDEHWKPGQTGLPWENLEVSDGK